MKNIKIIILLLFISNNFAFSNTTYANWNIEDLSENFNQSVLLSWAIGLIL